MSLANDRFKLEITQLENGAVVLLQGIMDEDANFTPLLRLGVAQLNINFRQIKSVNSCGIRNWVSFLKKLENTEIHYQECPLPIVRQINMVPSFLGQALVDSIYVPCVCDECEKEQTLLVRKEQFSMDSSPLVETDRCAHCKKGTLHLNGQPRQFFGFIKK